MLIVTPTTVTTTTSNAYNVGTITSTGPNGQPTIIIDIAPNTITETISSGNSMYTTTFTGADGTPIALIVIPIMLETVTTTITSGNSLFTTTATGTDGTVTALIATPTMVTVITSIAATSSRTFTTIGSNGQATVEVDLPCRTPGLRAAFYNNPFRRSNVNTPYANFDPSFFPSNSGGILKAVRYNGDIAFSVDSSRSVAVYGVSIALNYRTIIVETYIYSPIAQVLQFQASSDDIGFGYPGQKAYTGPFTRSNADDYEVAGTVGTPGLTRADTKGITAAAGSFTPLRFINGFDLYTSGTDGKYNQAFIQYQNVDATCRPAQFSLYSDVCPQDAPNFPASFS